MNLARRLEDVAAEKSELQDAIDKAASETGSAGHLTKEAAQMRAMTEKWDAMRASSSSGRSGAGSGSGSGAGSGNVPFRVNDHTLTASIPSKKTAGPGSLFTHDTFSPLNLRD